ncbi:MAG: metallophosphoesterase [Syntrophotaleaceae bacterium]
MQKNDFRPKDLRFISRRKFLASSLALGGSLSLGDALWLEPRSFVIEEILLPLPKMPPGKELRIVHLSDLHLHDLPPHFAEAANTVNALNPDLILLTGDYLEQEKNLKGVLTFLGLIKAARGVFAVQGNWEYWARLEGENLRRHFARVSVELLIDERRDLDIQDIPLSILGLDYPSASVNLNRIRQAADPQRLNLLLSHVPAFDHDMIGDRIDLILCGHTHGGQIRLPFLPPLYMPRFSGRFVSGLYRVAKQQVPLYLNRGLGTSVLPIRFLCRPEITLLRLGSLPA